MKNKKVLIIVISILILLLAAGLIFFLVKGKKKDGGNRNSLFSETDYPCEYKEVKDGVEFTLDGSKTPGLSWEYSADNQGIVEITPKADEKNGKITYLVKPVGGGFTEINFIRRDSLAGYSYDVADISFGLFSLLEDGGYKITVSTPEIQTSSYGIKVAEDTDYPFIMVTNAYDESTIVFPLGSYDWVFEDPSGKLIIKADFASDGRESYYFLRNPYAGVMGDGSSDNNIEEIEPDTSAFETTVTLSSEKLGITKYIKVKVGENDTITLSLTDDPE